MSIKPYFESKHCTLYHGDCLEIMPELADNSIDLIATDPPYFGVKDDDWDNQWKNTATFLDWMGELCQQWKRVLKPNGSLYVFASPQMSARVECKIGEYFNVLNNIRWVKEAGWHNKAEKENLRVFLSPWESVVFAEHFGADGMAIDDSGYAAKCDELRGFIFEPVRSYLAAERDKAGFTTRRVAEEYQKKTGSRTVTGMAGHWFERVQWTFPTAENYEWLQCLMNHNGGDYLRREYEDLRREYEDLRRPFNVSPQVPFTDVWDFKTVKPYAGKHVCEKPLAMMEHIINSSSRAGGVVLDCFVGSGTTLEAAQRLGRNSIGVEMDAHWCGQIERRLAQRDLFSVAIERAEIDAAQNLFLEPDPVVPEKQMEMVL